ncbi:MAG TPA: YbbR-like domain-containing protein [Bryobacteraceae bacterium]|nr:YbbR-like domain-containing protein [Bryobacteraceae bacterium]
MNLANLARLVTRHFWWKVLSLALAVGLWAAILGEPELVTMQTVPVLYNNLPRSLLLASDAASGVQLELRGPSRQLTRDRLAVSAVVLDLSGVTVPGEQTFTISRTELTIPEGVAFLRAIPSQLRLRFDRGMTKDVPVEIRLSGNPAPGFRISGISASPNQLRISGPESRVEPIHGAQTDTVDVSGLNAPAEMRINTFLADPRVQFESPSVVTVRINLERGASQSSSQPSQQP